MKQHLDDYWQAQGGCGDNLDPVERAVDPEWGRKRVGLLTGKTNKTFPLQFMPHFMGGGVEGVGVGGLGPGPADGRFLLGNLRKKGSD